MENFENTPLGTISSDKTMGSSKQGLEFSLNKTSFTKTGCRPMGHGLLILFYFLILH